jgi:hypothetical protein
VLGAQHTAMALEDLREDLAGLLPFALIGERRGEIVRGGQGVLVRLAEIPAVDPETTAEERFGLRILTLEPLEAAEGEEASAGISLIAAGRWADATLERWIRTSRRGAAISGWRTTGMDREAVTEFQRTVEISGAVRSRWGIWGMRRAKRWRS